MDSRIRSVRSHLSSFIVHRNGSDRNTKRLDTTKTFSSSSALQPLPEESAVIRRFVDPPATCCSGRQWFARCSDDRGVFGTDDAEDDTDSGWDLGSGAPTAGGGDDVRRSPLGGVVVDDSDDALLLASLDGIDCILWSPAELPWDASTFFKASCASPARTLLPSASWLVSSSDDCEDFEGVALTGDWLLPSCSSCDGDSSVMFAEKRRSRQLQRHNVERCNAPGTRHCYRPATLLAVRRISSQFGSRETILPAAGGGRSRRALLNGS